MRILVYPELGGEVVGDLGAEWGYIALIVDDAVEDSLVEVLMGGVEGVLHLQLLLRNIVLSLVQGHPRHHIADQLTLAVRSSAEGVEGVISHVLYCGQVHQEQSYPLYCPVGHKGDETGSDPTPAIARDVASHSVGMGGKHGIDQGTEELPPREVTTFGKDQFHLPHQSRPGYLCLIDESKQSQILLLKKLGLSLEDGGDGYQMWAVAIGIHLIFPLYFSAGLIALHDIVDLGGDLLLPGDFRDEGLIDVVFGQRTQPIPPGVLVGLHVDGELGGDLELSLENSSRIHFSLPESFVKLNCDLIRKDLHIVLSLRFQVHEQLSIELLLGIIEGSLHMVLLDDIPVHEVDRDDVDADVRSPRLNGQALYRILVVDRIALSGSEEEDPLLGLSVARVVEEGHAVTQGPEDITSGLGIGEFGLLHLMHPLQQLRSGSGNRMQFKEIIIILIMFGISEYAKAHLMRRVVVDLLLEGDLDTLQGQFQSGSTITVHLVHRTARIHHHHHHLLTRHSTQMKSEAGGESKGRGQIYKHPPKGIYGRVYAVQLPVYLVISEGVQIRDSQFLQINHITLTGIDLHWCQHILLLPNGRHLRLTISHRSQLRNHPHIELSGEDIGSPLLDLNGRTGSRSIDAFYLLAEDDQGGMVGLSGFGTDRGDIGRRDGAAGRQRLSLLDELFAHFSTGLDLQQLHEISQTKCYKS